MSQPTHTTPDQGTPPALSGVERIADPATRAALESINWRLLDVDRLVADAYIEGYVDALGGRAPDLPCVSEALRARSAR